MIRNKAKLAQGSLRGLRKKGLQIAEAGIEAVDASKAVKKAKLPDLRKFENVYVVGFGKASAKMAEAMEARLGKRIKEGAVVSVRKAGTKIMKAFKGTHPVPSAPNIRAAKKIVQIVEKAGRKDLVIALVSGGGSALLTLPAKGITLSEIQSVTKLLLRSKANIKEINMVRKHISQVKGGKLAEKVYPGTLIALQVSDVIGDDVKFMASGATCPDKSTSNDAIDVLKRRELWAKMPESVKRHLQKRASETPNRLKRSTNKVILNNTMALNAMQKKAKALGFKAIILSNETEGESKHVGRFLARHAIQLRHKYKRPIALLSGGETTVTMTGRGKGGRNQETALGALKELGMAGKMVIVAIGSDGIDGNSRAAGAIADSGTLAKALKKKMNPEKFLARNDSNSFFRKVNGEILTGYTETNVMDLQIVLAK